MRILITGGTGTFGRAVRPLLEHKHNVWAPPRKDLDVLDPKAWGRAVAIFHPDVVVHAAAYTGVDRAEAERELCWRVNVEGTRLGLDAVQPPTRFVFISSDYVFSGDKEGGSYEVNDPLGPVNHYAETKAAADVLVQRAPNGAVIRTSFAPAVPWRYPQAFVDLWTGKDYIDVLAPELALAIQTPFTGVVQIATARKSVFELAQRTRPNVAPIYRHEVGWPLPRDVSMSTASWEFTKKCWGRVARVRNGGGRDV